MTDIKRPALHYHGGKWELSPWVISFFPSHKVYVELFGGGASVLLRKTLAHTEIYNEIDGEVVNFFKVLRDPMKAEELSRQAVLTPYARGELLAAKPNPSDSEIERARKLAIRSYMGFSSSESMYRNKNRNGFRTPSGKSGNSLAQQWASWPAHIASMTRRLRGVTIECLPAVDAIKKYDSPETLFYADPPYVFSTRDKSGLYGGMYAHEMSDEQHRELGRALKNARGMVALSGYDCDLYAELYGGWIRHDKMSTTNTKTKKLESIWCNPRAASSVQGILL